MWQYWGVSTEETWEKSRLYSYFVHGSRQVLWYEISRFRQGQTWTGGSGQSIATELHHCLESSTMRQGEEEAQRQVR
jgi:hypothetical protein